MRDPHPKAVTVDEPICCHQRLRGSVPGGTARIRRPPSSGRSVRHQHLVDDLDDADALETHRLAVAAIAALRAVFAPEGFNVGWNLGRVAGAGIVDHAHLHVVPRWNGDTNFMPVLADVKVIPEHLLETRRKLAAAWPKG